MPTLIDAAGGNPNNINTGIKNNAGGEGFDGISFLGILTNPLKKHRDYVYGAHTSLGILNGSPYPIRSVRDSRYKLILNLNHEKKFNNAHTVNNGKKGKYYETNFAPLEKAAAKNQTIAKRLSFFQKRPIEELYDIKEDPFELKNLAQSKDHQEIKERLNAELKSWMIQQGDLGMETELAAKTRQGRQKKSKKNPADAK